MKRKFFIFLLFISMLFILFIPTRSTGAYKPKGIIVLHTYSDYNAMDSRIFLYDFSSDTLTVLMPAVSPINI